MANYKQDATINIRLTSNWISYHQNKYMGQHGITMPQFNILRILRGARVPLSISVIRDRMIEKSPNTTRLMDKLIDKGLIERLKDTKDNRVITIHITKQGLHLLKLIDKDFESNIILINNLTDEECEILSSLLIKARGGSDTSQENKCNGQ
jgi:MarR family transcriptional regulator, 2-MHQ and catechol-resistance regulon repressor